MSSYRRPPIRWATPKNIQAILSFVGLASLIVLLSVFLLKSTGVENFYLLVLVPIGPILVLTSSWIYLTELIAATPLPLLKNMKQTPSKPKTLAQISKDSAIMVLTIFCSLTLISYILMTPQVLDVSYWIFSTTRPLEYIFYEIDELLKPIYQLEVVYKFVLIENISALLVALATLNWKHIREIIP